MEISSKATRETALGYLLYLCEYFSRRNIPRSSLRDGYESESYSSTAPSNQVEEACEECILPGPGCRESENYSGNIDASSAELSRLSIFRKLEQTDTKTSLRAAAYRLGGL
jgi:hypothetical protein